MFKGILQSRRPPSTDFTMITSLQDVSNSMKENYPTRPYQPVNRGIKNTLVSGRPGTHPNDKIQSDNKTKELIPSLPVEQVEMDHAFDQLLDDLQIPSGLRPKLVGMDSTVKAAMLKSSTILAKQPREVPSVLPGTPRRGTLRRAVSTESLGSPIHVADQDVLDPPRPTFAGGQVSAHHSPYLSRSSPRNASGSHTRGLSFDTQRLFSRSQVNLTTESSVDLTSSTGPPGGKDKGTVRARSISPTKFCSILTGTSTLHLDIEDVRKLRLFLRNESASWSQEFLKLGGYSALLTRLNEILEVEWREEQHDDQVLHELLRCLKALSTSSIGCFALRSSCPTPFVQLVSLLYSDKKPGDIATRQLIVDLLLTLFELYPSSSLPSGSSRRQREAWESETFLQSNLIVLPVPHKNVFSLIRALLLTPPPPPSECPKTPISPHAFIENLHKPRIYKTYLKELSDVCRDYFWVFCHPNNTIWVLSETDETKVEKPRAPGGMTGGVESEAVGYLTIHIKLINSIAQNVASLGMPKDHEFSAYQFHSNLFLSGLERIILISRKASITYYPTLHLELSRYINHAVRAGYELPYTVSRLIGLPPTSLCKNIQPVAGVSTTTQQQLNQSPGRRTQRHQPQSQPGTPTKRTAPAHALPSPKRIEPIKFD